MKTIAINSTKGGTGKSTLSVIFANALVNAGYKCLVIDTDASNSSASYYLDEGGSLRNGKGTEYFQRLFWWPDSG
ncbi:hypothetical protein AGMMS49940_20230 [Spirochaetia bacterium]|nr:hypothetical protein AGMMS49940_20230 [Spirochaetia bacterium]